jgi:hypothetical protein
MFRSINRACVPVLILIIFGIQTILSSPESYAQGLMKINDNIGGSNVPAQTQDSGGDNTTLWIVGGTVIAGVLIYELFIHKKESKKEEKQDSTTTESLLLRSHINFASDTPSERFREIQDIPVNLYIGFQKVDPVLSERKFIMGISCTF